MADEDKGISGYGFGSVDTVISVDHVDEQASQLIENAPTRDDLVALVGNELRHERERRSG